nr:MAG TPA: hypothetical protein [Caudoviricetes sp.]
MYAAYLYSTYLLRFLYEVFKVLRITSCITF